MEKTTKVYYVTAAAHGSGADPGALHEERIAAAAEGRPERPVRRASRVELAKFFAPEHAHAHVRTLGPGWVDVDVEEREEPKESQHYAHGGKLGLPTAP